jgi:heterodisulfide reductase subunit A
MRDSALVVGGGIAGIQAALDLAENGIKVYVVEKGPAIGGRMSQLDKTFPTMDCSMCIESPKMSEVGRHPNIEILRGAEVENVDGSAGDFSVRIRQRSSLVSDECTGCGDCVSPCPVALPNEYDLGLTTRKAIYTPFHQAVPSQYVVDTENCLNKPNMTVCNRCVEACQPKCIDFNLPRENVLNLNVGSIIVSSGMKVFNPRTIEEYGYGKYPDVLTALEFERMLSATGPTEGELTRISDRETPKRIVFVQCVGSRDSRNFEYCSRVCCTYSIKEALLAKEHLNNLEITILYMDVRAYGKGFERFYERAIDEGIKFVRGRPSRVLQDGSGLKLRIEDTENGSLKEIEADMVVLAPAIVPPQHIHKLANILGIETDDYGFFKEKNVLEPLESSRDGIYLCGASTGPKDISETVSQASGAVSKALSHLSGTFEEVDAPVQAKLDPEPRVGVIVCGCGTNIAKVVDVPDVTDYSSGIPNVVYAAESLFACSDSAQKEISEAIEKHGLNRVVIAACSPRTHEPIFMSVCEDAGLNPYLLEMVNIRNHNSWVHKDKASATSKAKELVRIGIAKARHLSPLAVKSSDVVQKALVVGGGISGMTAAIALSKLGIETSLVETENALGGRLRELHKLAPDGIEAKEILDSKIDELEKSGVEVHLEDKVGKVDGFVGNFDVTLTSGKKMPVGSLILATGASLYAPNEFGYGTDPSVITNLELEKRLPNVDEDKITFISCVGSRNEERECARYCCQTMIHQALELNEIGKKVRVLYRDIRTFGKGAEELYKEALEKGVLFFRFKEQPEYKEGVVKVLDELVGSYVNVPTDLIVLVLGMTPHDTELVESLKLPRSEDGFLMELHPKLGPVELSSKGVFLAGTVQGPKDIRDSVSQALATAAKASAVLSRERIKLEPIVAVVNEEMCRWCGRCTEVCEYNAIDIKTAHNRKVAAVNEVLCRGCGVCSVVCPTGAMDIAHFSHAQLRAMIDELEH